MFLSTPILSGSGGVRKDGEGETKVGLPDSSIYRGRPRLKERPRYLLFSSIVSGRASGPLLPIVAVNPDVSGLEYFSGIFT